MITRIFFIFLFMFVQSGFSQNSIKAKSIQKLFDYLTNKHLFSGAVLVADDGRTIYKHAFGFANMEWKIPNTTDTKFEIGSVTKQFTAVLILQLAAERTISLTDTVSKYLPEMPEKWGDKITIHQLLTHTSGLPSHYSSMADYMKKDMRISYTFKERLEQIRNCELEFEPGTSWSYNGFGYTILGAVVARVTKKSLEDNYQTRIFDRLGMTQSGVFFDSRLISGRAYGYQKRWDDTYIPPVYFSQTEAKLGGGGLYSTVEDLLKWHRALQGDTFLPSQIKKTGFTSYFRFPDGDGYCYGHYATKYEIDKDRCVEVFFHGGSLPGSSSLILRVPKNDQCIVLLHNGGMGHEEFLQSIATEILNILYQKEFQLPKMSILYTVGYTALFENIEEVKKHYYYLKNNLNDAYIFDPDQLNFMGMVLMQFGALDNVSGVFKLNIEEYPDHYLSYYELGKFYCDVEKKYDCAKIYLEKAVELSEGETKAEIEKKLAETETHNEND